MEQDYEGLDDEIDESGEKLTQRRIDDDDDLVDVDDEADLDFDGPE